LYVNINNLAAIKAYEKAGFIAEMIDANKIYMSITLTNFNNVDERHQSR